MSFYSFTFYNLQSAKGSNTWVRSLKWNDSILRKGWSVIFFCGADKNVLYKILYHQKLLVLKEHVYMGIALLGETLKDMLAGCSYVLNAALAGLARNIVGAQITVIYPVGYSAGKCGWASPLNWSGVASCEWGAESLLLAWHDARTMLAPGAVQTSSAAALPNGGSTAYAVSVGNKPPKGPWGMEIIQNSPGVWAAG